MHIVHESTRLLITKTDFKKDNHKKKIDIENIFLVIYVKQNKGSASKLEKLAQGPEHLHGSTRGKLETSEKLNNTAICRETRVMQQKCEHAFSTSGFACYISVHHCFYVKERHKVINYIEH